MIKTGRSLRGLLMDEADTAMEGGQDDYQERYTEHDNPAALTDAWLDDRSSYIWRVGVLTRIDGNKADWMHVFIGHEREPGKAEFIGHLAYEDGENDDPGRCLARVLDLLAMQHPSFDAERHAEEPAEPVEPSDLEEFIGDAYQRLGDIMADLPDAHPVMARVLSLMDDLADPAAAIAKKA